MEREDREREREGDDFGEMARQTATNIFYSVSYVFIILVHIIIGVAVCQK